MFVKLVDYQRDEDDDESVVTTYCWMNLDPARVKHICQDPDDDTAIKVTYWNPPDIDDSMSCANTADNWRKIDAAMSSRGGLL